MGRPNRLSVVLALALLCGTTRLAAAPGEPEPADATSPASRSPWLALPTLASNPKLGTSVGAMGAYLHNFDKDSRVSIFGVGVQYTTTDSKIAGLISRASWGADHHRLTAGAALGFIRNDYDDYLGTGVPLRTDDDLRALFVRYVYRIEGDWFVGGQFVRADYQVLGFSDWDDMVLETLGVKGFESAGVGAVLMHDSRDNQDMPVRGWMLNFNNVAYRESLGGSDSFDTYRLDDRWFFPIGDRSVLAVRQMNQFTQDAPLAANATIMLRGYKPGQYLGKNMSSIEVEERWRFGARWGANLFVGAACLYGAALDCSAETYTSWGAGLQWIVKPDQKMVLNLELAHGEGDSNAAILKLGYAW